MNHFTKMFSKTVSLLARAQLQAVVAGAFGGVSQSWKNIILSRRALLYSTPLVAVFGMNLLRMVTTSGRLMEECITVSSIS